MLFVMPVEEVIELVVHLPLTDLSDSTNELQEASECHAILPTLFHCGMDEETHSGLARAAPRHEAALQEAAQDLRLVEAAVAVDVMLLERFVQDQQIVTHALYVPRTDVVPPDDLAFALHAEALAPLLGSAHERLEAPQLQLLPAARQQGLEEAQEAPPELREGAGVHAVAVEPLEKIQALLLAEETVAILIENKELLEEGTLTNAPENFASPRHQVHGKRKKGQVALDKELQAEVLHGGPLPVRAALQAHVLEAVEKLRRAIRWAAPGELVGVLEVLALLGGQGLELALPLDLLALCAQAGLGMPAKPSQTHLPVALHPQALQPPQWLNWLLRLGGRCRRRVFRRRMRGQILVSAQL
mmetsp:Transcript_41586/g.120421  ORF Transcript_41586/g.120421 Transcript_41586/m.120421 type:complete len:358 (+) Transcript_41586:589-1662(+)